ncbi:type II secretion system minor pseudopilin GspH [Vibrio ruber]|uniref:Type II secretion system protein H n=1 Tax=Vibrio ruber (strain DSM 16370 / JCM 11486 / BCRC 17186 / CECT 7878 / LMG 23124 / VR1) TaxID=1123498 RepID=A0A1R4LQ85_VIBR1|nr:type II secretion system minor pseudopilin GspH [Vibrio ruber]WNJ96869.1 type II secretion system minor pseudopilin GspH [Vibrio ruber]SJN58549.1 Type II secretion system protein H precursor [Vibrio ruber DSM 16370]
MKYHRGFTLLEIMLVLVVISLGSMVVVMSLPDRSQDEVQQTAERLYQRLQLLSEDAIFSGRTYGLYVDEKKHQFLFLMLSDKGWKNLEAQSPIKGELTAEAGTMFRFESGGGVWNNPERLFSQESLFEEMDFPDQDEDEKPIPPPQVFILSSGDITPFSIQFWADSTPDSLWLVETSEDGILQIQTPSDQNDEAN